MTAGGRSVVEGGPPCGNCGATTWDLGWLAGPAEHDPEQPGEAFVAIEPTPMARCAACRWSQNLADP